MVNTVTVGTDPHAVIYDPGTNEIFSANLGSNTVSVFCDSNDGVVATIPVMALLVFNLLYIAPGDPAAVNAGDQETPADVETSGRASASTFPPIRRMRGEFGVAAASAFPEVFHRIGRLMVLAYRPRQLPFGQQLLDPLFGLAPHA